MNVKDSLLGRSTEGRNLKHFNVSVSIFHYHLHMHTDMRIHTVSSALPHSLLLPLLLSLKLLTFMSWPSFYLQARFIPLPYNVLWGSPPSSSPSHKLHMEAAPVTLLADIWKCFGPALEVTVWTNRDHTSTFAMWQAFIYLPDLMYCMETPPTSSFHPFYTPPQPFTSPSSLLVLISFLSSHLLPPSSSPPIPTAFFFFQLHLSVKCSISFVSASMRLHPALPVTEGGPVDNNKLHSDQMILVQSESRPRSKEVKLIPIIPPWIILTWRMSAVLQLCLPT